MSERGDAHKTGGQTTRVKKRAPLLRWWDQSVEKLRVRVKRLLKPLYRRLQIRSVVAWFVPGWGEVSKSPGGIALTGRFLPGTVDASPLIAVVGDYGSGKQPAYDVAELIADSGTSAVVTVGDNVYFQTGYHALVGNLYGDFLKAGAFFPAAGNHDYSEGRGIYHFDRYFDFLQGNRWYRVTLGDIEFFILDSHQALHHPEVFDAQYHWLEKAVAESDARWKVVVVHHPPHSARSRSQKEFRFPFDAWEIDLVLSGHDHTFQHLIVDQVHYVVNGVGGGSLHKFEEILEGTEYRLSGRYGAFFIRPEPDRLDCWFQAIDGEIPHRFEVHPRIPTT